MNCKLIVFAMVAFSLSSAGYSKPLDELEHAETGCALGKLAFKIVAGEMNYDIDAMATQEGREAFLAKVLKWDDGALAPTFKPTWLLSYAAALEEMRETAKRVGELALRMKEGERDKAREKDMPLLSGERKFKDACMFGAGKLAAQGRLLPAAQ
jgi:hypothetical protein